MFHTAWRFWRKHLPEVWVLSPKRLSAFIVREPVTLKREDVALVASRIINDMQKP